MVNQTEIDPSRLSHFTLPEERAKSTEKFRDPLAKRAALREDFEPLLYTIFRPRNFDLENFAHFRNFQIEIPWPKNRVHQRLKIQLRAVPGRTRSREARSGPAQISSELNFGPLLCTIFGLPKFRSKNFENA